MALMARSVANTAKKPVARSRRFGSSRPSPAPADAALRIAAIDVGSNSIHMVVAQADADGGVTTLWRMKEMVGLGRISFPSQRLSHEAMDRAVDDARAASSRPPSAGRCEKIVAVATSAVREAENGGDFLERVRRELGLHVRVVSARDEARLIYLGVRHAVDLKDEPAPDRRHRRRQRRVHRRRRDAARPAREPQARRGPHDRQVTSSPTRSAAGDLKALLAPLRRASCRRSVETIRSYKPVARHRHQRHAGEPCRDVRRLRTESATDMPRRSSSAGR